MFAAAHFVLHLSISMSVVLDRDCQLQLLPTQDAGSCFLVSGVSGEIVALEDHMIMEYDDEGSAVLYVDGDSQTAGRFVAKWLRTGVFKTDGGEVYLQKDEGPVQWLSEAAKEEEAKTVTLGSMDIFVIEKKIPVDGATVFWTMRDFIENMDTRAWTPQYREAFIAHSTPRWQEFFEDVQVPASSVIISHAAKNTRIRLKQNRPLPEAKTEFMFSTFSMLALLTRWSTINMNKFFKLSCNKVLMAFVDAATKHAGPDGFFIYVNIDAEDGHLFPSSLQHSTHRAELRDGMILAEPFMQDVASLRGAMAQTWPQFSLRTANFNQTAS